MATDLDGVLVQWGERLFYPGNRTVRSHAPRLSESQGHASRVRARIQATVVRRAPQVMVKVTGGGRGMAAIAAHFRYISKSGRLAFEDDRGVTREGKEALQNLAEQWRLGGSRIEETSPRREALNVMLSMPRGTDALTVQRAAREFATTELSGHRYVMVLHDHQANPHVHLSVRMESTSGSRLNPRKADLQRWRETFAEKLRGWGLDAEATRQASRGETRNYPALWQVQAAQAGRLRTKRPSNKTRGRSHLSRAAALRAWGEIATALDGSPLDSDRALAEQIRGFVSRTPFVAQSRTRAEPGRDLTAAPGHASPASIRVTDGPTRPR